MYHAVQIPGAWSNERIAAVLGNRLATAAIRGKSQPVAQLVLARIEGSK